MQKPPRGGDPNKSAVVRYDPAFPHFCQYRDGDHPTRELNLMWIDQHSFPKSPEKALHKLPSVHYNSMLKAQLKSLVRD
jgi:hypothetical protein